MNGVEAGGAPTNWRRVAERVAIVLLAVLLVGALLRSARDVQTYVGIDLVPKVGGAQRFFAHVSPYIGWDAQQAGFLPDVTSVLRFSRCSYPPTLLLVYRIGAWVDYRLIRYAWAIAEWTALLISIAVVVAASTNAVERWGAAFVGIVFFACSYFFRLHVERGQYYIFVTLFWALAWGSSRRVGLNTYATGFFLGLAAAIRPTSIVALVPLGIFRRWQALSGALTGFAAMVGASLAVGGMRAWTDFAGLARYVAECIVNVPGGQQAPPAGATLAGYDAVALLNAKTTNTSVFGQIVTLARALHAHADEPLLSFISEAIVAAATLITFAFMIRAGKRPSDRQIVLWSLFIALICDFAAPVRYGYADVLYLVPIAVALPYLLASFFRAGHAGWAGPLVLGAFCWSIAVDINFVSTLARSLCVMTALALVLFSRESNRSSNDDHRSAADALPWSGRDGQEKAP